MDLHTVTAVRRATSRADLAGLGPDTVVLAGGSWLYSDPQVHLRGLVDLMTLDWPALTVTDAGLEIAATCTLAELSRFAPLPGTPAPQWTAVPLFRQCCTALRADRRRRPRGPGGRGGGGGAGHRPGLVRRPARRARLARSRHRDPGGGDPGGTA